MYTSLTEVANAALGYLGITSKIGDLETENSPEARAVNTYIAIAIDETLSEWPWPFATRFSEIQVVEENPTPDWGYSYRYPSNCVMVRRIVPPGLAFEPRMFRLPFRISADDDGKLILTNEYDPTIEYTARVNDVQQWPPDFCNCIAMKLAFYISAELTGGDPNRLGNKALEMYLLSVSKAQARAANEEQSVESPPSSLESARDE